MHLIVFLIGFVLLLGSQSAVSKQPFTVADSIETTRTMSREFTRTVPADDVRELDGSSPVAISPDGHRYVAMLVRGDLTRNGVWMELIAGRLDSLESASRVQTVARFFTKALGARDSIGYGSAYLVHPFRNPPVWLEDNQRVLFYWEDDKAVRQVVAVNVDTHHVEYLTHHQSEVVEFGMSRRGTLLYAARVQYSRTSSDQFLANGFVVRSPDAISLLNGFVDGTGHFDAKYTVERFISVPGHSQARRLATPGGGISAMTSVGAKPAFSSSGRWAIFYGTPDEVPPEWEMYGHRPLRDRVRGWRQGLRATERQIYQPYVAAIESTSARPLWNVPLVLPDKSVHLAWSPDERSVLLGPSFLPIAQANASGLAGTAVVEVEVSNGRFRQLPIPAEWVAKDITGVNWISNDTVEVGFAGSDAFIFRKRNEVWEGATARPKPKEQTLWPPIRVELRQDLNTPPALFAVEVTTGRERMIFDPNPGLREKYLLGRVEHVSWEDDAGMSWHGLLYYPVKYTPNERYPLVIQTRGRVTQTAFSLTGTNGTMPGLGPGFAAYAAQPLANRGIAVLQVSDQPGLGRDFAPDEPKAYTRAYEAAVKHFAAAGIVDRNRVGLMGFSRSGWWVEYALTHSEFPFAAALIVDNANGGYLQAALLSWPIDYSEGMNGAPPFGDGLKLWFEHAPAFNAHRVQAPLQMQSTSAGLPLVLTNAWEMFSRLRRLSKPVELYVIPNFEYGTHGIQNPQQCLAAQQRAVDWWDFWLRNYEDPDSEKADQYAQWRALRVLRDSDAENARIQVPR